MEQVNVAWFSKNERNRMAVVDMKLIIKASLDGAIFVHYIRKLKGPIKGALLSNTKYVLTLAPSCTRSCVNT